MCSPDGSVIADSFSTSEVVVCAKNPTEAARSLIPKAQSSLGMRLLKQ